MPIATGVNKLVGVKKETNWGVAAGAAGAQLLSRLESDLSLEKDTYRSEEMASHFQQADVRHGVRSVKGTFKGELAPGASQWAFAAALRKVFTLIVAPITGLTITVTGTGPTYTVARSAGDWLAAGVKIGHVFRLTAGGFNAANLNKNLVVLGVTALNLTVIPLNGVAMFAEAGITAATATFPGMQSFAPPSGHTDESFTIEHWHQDIGQSEQFLGCKVSTLGVDLPSTGMSKIDIALMGKDMATGVAQYFTTPAAPSTAGKLAAVNGALMIAGTPVAQVTGLKFGINGNMTADAVVGSNTYPDIFEGRIITDGEMTVMFQDAVARDQFINETEVSVVGAFATGPSGLADFISICYPRIKFKSAKKNDGEKAILQTMTFDALYLSTGGSGQANNQTSVQVHDSLAV